MRREWVRLSIKFGFLGLLDAFSVTAAILMALEGEYLFLGFLLVIIGGINYLAFSGRAYPLRYVFTSVVFLVIFVVFPILYTLYVSFTNTSTGHLLNKEQALEVLLDRTYQPENPQTFDYWAYTNDAGTLRVILRGEDDEAYLSTSETELTEIDLSDPRFERDDDGTIIAFDGFQKLELRALYQNSNRLERMEFELGDVIVKLANIREFRTYRRQYEYVASEDTLIDQQTGKEYRPIEGTFTSADGDRLQPGFRTLIGVEKYVEIFTNPSYRGPILGSLVWTFEFALGSVFLSFAVGLGLAMILNDPNVRFKYFYRSVLILSWVIPAFISASIWRGMLHEELGYINQLLGPLLGLKIGWLNDPPWPRLSLLFINAWLTFPYMLVISLGALQSIPRELYEAAFVDGAGAIQRFRKVTLPLLMIPIAPLLIGSFAFTFNNFTLIWFVTRGRPSLPGADLPIGYTDILISSAYRIAFEGTQTGSDLALASAFAILIFILIAGVSAFNFRYTRALEDVRENV